MVQASYNEIQKHYYDWTYDQQTPPTYGYQIASDIGFFNILQCFDRAASTTADLYITKSKALVKISYDIS